MLFSRRSHQVPFQCAAMDRFSIQGARHVSTGCCITWEGGGRAAGSATRSRWMQQGTPALAASAALAGRAETVRWHPRSALAVPLAATLARARHAPRSRGWRAPCLRTPAGASSSPRTAAHSARGGPCAPRIGVGRARGQAAAGGATRPPRSTMRLLRNAIPRLPCDGRANSAARRHHAAHCPCGACQRPRVTPIRPTWPAWRRAGTGTAGKSPAAHPARPRWTSHLCAGAGEGDSGGRGRGLHRMRRAPPAAGQRRPTNARAAATGR